MLHDFQIIKLESHSEDLGLLKPSYILVASRRSVKYPLILFRMGFFGTAHRWAGQKGPLPRKSVTHILQ